MKFKIKHISFLLRGEREIVKSNLSGRFLARGDYTGFRGASKPLTAFEFVSLPKISESDPVVNLKNGDKMRVYFGGDPSQMVVQTQCAIEFHDSQIKEFEEERTRKREERKKNKNKEDEYEQTTMFGDIDIFEDLQGW